jgi:arabinofuranosyltransferase
VAIAPGHAYLHAVTTRRLPTWTAILPALALLALLAARLDLLCDDAFISFRYARNLARGDGLVFNPGESPPVEGYSNLLWVLYLAPFSALGLDLGLVARLTSAACALLLVGWTAHHARRRLGIDGLGAGLTALFLASLPATALWATGGLATMPFALALFGVWAGIDRAPAGAVHDGDAARRDGEVGAPAAPGVLGAALAAVLAVLLRADGFLWLGMLLAGGLLGLPLLEPEARRARLRALVVVGAAVAVTFAGQVGFRLAYHGDWLPNTARVKAGLSAARLSRGLDHAAQWLLSMPALALVLLGSLRRFPRAEAPTAITAWTLVLGGLAYSTWVGGDFMPFGRFLVATLPFVALLLALLWRRVDARRPGLAAGLVLALAAAGVGSCFGLDLVPRAVRARFHFRLSSPTGWQSELEMRDGMQARAEEWTVRGRALARFARPGDSIVLKGIGAIGYHSDLFVHDVHGLVSPEVIAASGEPRADASPGHDREVPTTFFFQRPDPPTLAGAYFVPLGAPPEAGLPPGFRQHPIFRRLSVERHPLPDEPGFPPATELRLLRLERP